MKIDIADAVMSEGEVFSAEFDGTLADIEYMGEHYRFDGGVHVAVDYWFDSGEVTVRGRLSARLIAQCSRCLKEILYPVDLEFIEHYKERGEDGEYPFSGEEIDLDRMLCDNVVMNLPGKLLCSEDCKGLCSVCGQDLNSGLCGCGDKIDETNPFYSLSKLYDDEEV